MLQKGTTAPYFEGKDQNGTPVGSGIALLVGLGAAYVIEEEERG
jgi:hypothetical protein